MVFIDFQKLKRLHPQDKFFQQDVIDTFIKRIPAYSHCLEISLEAKDTETLLAYCYQLRGAAECCCIHELEALCIKLGNELRKDNLQNATGTVLRLKKALHSIQKQYPSTPPYSPIFQDFS